MVSKEHKRSRLHSIEKKVVQKSKQFFSLLIFPLLIFTAWYLVSLVTSFINFNLYLSFFSGLPAWLLILLIYSILGWTLVEDHNKRILDAVKLAMILGVIVGMIGAITGIIMIKTNPAIMDYAMQQFAKYNYQFSNEEIQTQVMIGGYIGFISGPIINAVLGAGLAALGGFVAKKKWIKL